MEEINSERKLFIHYIWIIIGVIIVILIFAVVVPLVKPWWAQQTGMAELSRAEQNRQIVVIQALADKEAEITRAEGVAKANEIIGNSLKGKEEYLRYLYITGITSKDIDREIIYLPTEAGQPILEAGRLNQ